MQYFEETEPKIPMQYFADPYPGGRSLKKNVMDKAAIVTRGS